MATRVEERPRAATGRGADGGRLLMRLSSETKHAFKTTEFWAMVAIVVGILIAAKAIGSGADGMQGDAFTAQRAWLYIAIVGSAYMVSRGLAKAGSRDPYWADPDDLPGGRDSGR